MNDEARMTKSEGNPNDEVVFRKVVARRRHLGFGINSSFVIRASSFESCLMALTTDFVCNLKTANSLGLVRRSRG
jgi:hypothetical protein